MNVLLLAAGEAADHDSYPLCLSEFDGEPLIAKQLSACAGLEAEKIIVAMPKTDVEKFHLDNVVRLLEPKSVVVKIENPTSGAACTALLAAGFIDNDKELLIINANELIDVNFADIVGGFRERSLAAGVLTFKSVHPRYSYVKLDDSGFVMEAAEKRPISQNATVGFYWYRHGHDFVNAAKNMIRKGASVQGGFYICPVFNEFILEQKQVGSSVLDIKKYHPLKSEREIDRYEAVSQRSNT